MTTPSDFVGYGAFYQVLSQLRDACKAELQKLGALPGRAGIVPGAISWDDCECNGGQLSLSLNQIFLSDQFPVPLATTDQGQGAIIAGELVVQLIRCAPALGPNGEPPSSADLDASAQRVLTDAYAIFCTVTTELGVLKDGFDIFDYLVRNQVIIGPEGSCVGSELTVTVGLSR